MKLLLDTHTWIWRLLDPDRISVDAEAAIADSQSELFLSPISTWETLILARKGRLAVPQPPREWVLEALQRSAMKTVPLNHGIALRSESLSEFGSEDPADRFLVATALEHDLTLITADRAMHDFAFVKTLW
jgi:PIN domain nuclease of toxin-antitoxin system